MRPCILFTAGTFALFSANWSFAGFRDSFSGAVSSVQQKRDAVRERLSDGREKTSQAVSSAKDQWNQGKQQTQQAFDASKDRLNDAKDRTSQAVEKGRDQWNQGKERAGQAFDTSKDRLNDAKDRTNQAVEKGRDQWTQGKEHAGQAFDAAKDRATETKERVGAIADTTQDKIGEGKERLERFGEKTTERFSDGKGAVVGYYAEHKPVIADGQERLERSISLVKSGASNLSHDSRNLWEKSQGIRNTLRTSAETAAGHISANRENIRSFTEKVVSSGKQIVWDAGKNQPVRVSDAIDQTKLRVRSGGARIYEATINLSSSEYSVGKEKLVRFIKLGSPGTGQ